MTVRVAHRCERSDVSIRWIIFTSAAVALLLQPSAALAQNSACATFDPPAAFRADSVRVVFKTSPTAPAAGAPAPTVTFSNTSGKAWTAPLTLDAGRGTFVLPADIPLGGYTAKFGDACTMPFEVRSPVRLTVTGLSPNGTQWANNNEKDVTLAIHGTGFVTSAPDTAGPWTDNQLYINDDLVRKVSWNPPSSPRCEDSSVTSTQADVLDAQTIRVCHLDLSALGNDEGWFVWMGIKATTARISVGQPGVLPTSPWPFRLYPWWAGGVTVTLAAVVLTLMLAGLVLLFVYTYKKSKKQQGVRVSARSALFLDLETDTYSLSKLQFYLWTAAALYGYIYLVVSRLFVQGAEWPEVPDNLPGIIGIGIATAVGATVATNIRGPKGSGTERPSLGDFVMSGGVVAADRVQMLVWTLVGVGIFVVAVAQHGPTDIDKLDTIPSTLLVLSGISSAGYLSGKLARKPGPVLDEIHIEPPDSDEALANAAVPPPGTVDVSAALSGAQNAVLPAPAAPTAKAAVDALTQAKSIAQGVKTVAQATTALPALVAQRQIAEASAASAAAALVKVDTPENALAAQTAQRAAGAIADLEAAATTAAGTFPNQSAGAPRFERVITLRGRNLSPNGIFSIDTRALPFRMLAPDPADPQVKRVPVMLIPETDSPEMAMSMKLTIDPGQLSDADRQVYDAWFRKGQDKTLTFRITNPDGQQDDLSFTVPPAAAQAPGKGGGGAAGGNR